MNRGLDKIIKIYEKRVNDTSLNLGNGPEYTKKSSSQQTRIKNNIRKREIDLETLGYLKELKKILDEGKNNLKVDEQESTSSDILYRAKKDRNSVLASAFNGEIIEDSNPERVATSLAYHYDWYG